jgi:hypothetical protein
MMTGPLLTVVPAGIGNVTIFGAVPKRAWVHQ